MRSLLLLGVLLSAFSSLPIEPAWAQQETQTVGTKSASGLRLSLSANKLTFKKTDAIKLQVNLINPDFTQFLFVYGTLDWGHLASLTLYVHDAQGKRVTSKFYDDALTPPLKSGDNTQFVKLKPQHLIGTYYSSTIHELNIDRPGIYKIYVEYRCPLNSSEVELRPFFGREQGTLRSNVVAIGVVR